MSTIADSLLNGLRQVATKSLQNFPMFWLVGNAADVILSREPISTLFSVEKERVTNAAKWSVGWATLEVIASSVMEQRRNQPDIER